MEALSWYWRFFADDHPCAPAKFQRIEGCLRFKSSATPPFTALSRQGGYAHILKGYFYTNLVGTLTTQNIGQKISKSFFKPA
jgi:hypothetical protein